MALEEGPDEASFLIETRDPPPSLIQVDDCHLIVDPEADVRIAPVGVDVLDGATYGADLQDIDVGIVTDVPHAPGPGVAEDGSPAAGGRRVGRQTMRRNWEQEGAPDRVLERLPPA